MSDHLTVRAYGNAYATKAEIYELTWGELTDEIVEGVRECTAKGDKKLLPALSVVVTDPPDALRANEHIIGVGALVLDIDRMPKGVSAALLCKRLHKLGCAAVVYATSSDTPKARRLRLVIKLDRVATTLEAGHARFAMAEALGIGPDHGVEGAKAAAQLFFVGRLEGTPPRDVWVIEGDGLCVGDFAKRKLEHKWAAIHPALPTPRRVRDDTIPETEHTERVRVTATALSKYWTPPGEITPGGGRRPVLRALGGWLARLGWSDGEIAALVTELPTERGPDACIKLAIECARQCRDTEGEVAAGYDSLRTWANSAGAIRGLDQAERAARDPRAPEGFPGVWSEWWARVYARAYRWLRLDGARETADNAHAHPSALTSAARGARANTLEGEADAGTAEAGEGRERLDYPDQDKKGVPIPTARNVHCLVSYLFDDALAWDNGYGVPVLRRDFTYLHALLKAGRLSEGVDTAVLMLCEQTGLRASMALVHAVVLATARENSYWPLQEYAQGLEWDGVARVDRAFVEHWGADDTPANVASARVFFLGAALRMIEPGANVHTALYLQGGEGAGKSRSIKALAPRVEGEHCYSDAPLGLDSKDAPAALRGVSLYEVAENQSFSRRDQAQIRHWLSIAVDDYRPPYERYRVQVPRTSVFVITTNALAFLAGDAENRRALPVRVGDRVDVEMIAKHRDQFWAEAVARLTAGERPWITDEEKLHLTLARDAVADDGEDPWQIAIAAYLAKHKEPIAVADLATDALMVPLERVDRRCQDRVTRVLREIGWVRQHTRHGKRWAPPAGAKAEVVGIRRKLGAARNKMANDKKTLASSKT